MVALALHVLAEAGNPFAAATVKRPLKRGIMWATVGVKGTVLEKMKAIKEAGFNLFDMSR